MGTTIRDFFECNFRYDESMVDYDKHQEALDKLHKHLIDNSWTGIFIQAPSSSGKTHLMRWLTNYLNATYICAYSKHISDESTYFEIPILLIDALGLESPTSRETIRRLIQIRKHLGKRTIIATNSPIEDLKVGYGTSFVTFILDTFVPINYGDKNSKLRR